MGKQIQIIFSATGRTEKTAQIFAEAFGGTWTTVHLGTQADCTASVQIEAEDLCLVAVPVFEGRIPRPAAQRLKKLQGNGATAILMAVYGNRAIDDCLLEMRDVLTEQGFRCRAAMEAVAEHSIFPIYGHGRPDDADKQELTAFAAAIKTGLSSNTLPGSVKVPGKFPYIDMGGVSVHPAANEACVSCGACAAVCPVSAIPKDNPSATDNDKCITCMRCASICPQGARGFHEQLYTMMEKKMEPKLSGRKTNVLYIEGV